MQCCCSKLHEIIRDEFALFVGYTVRLECSKRAAVLKSSKGGLMRSSHLVKSTSREQHSAIGSSPKSSKCRPKKGLPSSSAAVGGGGVHSGILSSATDSLHSSSTGPREVEIDDSQLTITIRSSQRPLRSLRVRETVRALSKTCFSHLHFVKFAMEKPEALPKEPLSALLSEMAVDGTTKAVASAMMDVAIDTTLSATSSVEESDLLPPISPSLELSKSMPISVCRPVPMAMPSSLKKKAFLRSNTTESFPMASKGKLGAIGSPLRSGGAMGSPLRGALGRHGTAPLGKLRGTPPMGALRGTPPLGGLRTAPAMGIAPSSSLSSVSSLRSGGLQTLSECSALEPTVSVESAPEQTDCDFIELLQFFGQVPVETVTIGEQCRRWTWRVLVFLMKSLKHMRQLRVNVGGFSETLPEIASQKDWSNFIAETADIMPPLESIWVNDDALLRALLTVSVNRKPVTEGGSDSEDDFGSLIDEPPDISESRSTPVVSKMAKSHSLSDLQRRGESEPDYDSDTIPSIAHFEPSKSEKIGSVRRLSAKRISFKSDTLLSRVKRKSKSGAVVRSLTAAGGGCEGASLRAFKFVKYSCQFSPTIAMTGPEFNGVQVLEIAPWEDMLLNIPPSVVSLRLSRIDEFCDVENWTLLIHERNGIEEICIDRLQTLANMRGLGKLRKLRHLTVRRRPHAWEHLRDAVLTLARLSPLKYLSLLFEMDKLSSKKGLLSRKMLQALLTDGIDVTEAKRMRRRKKRPTAKTYFVKVFNEYRKPRKIATIRQSKNFSYGD